MLAEAVLAGVEPIKSGAMVVLCSLTLVCSVGRRVGQRGNERITLPALPRPNGLIYTGAPSLRTAGALWSFLVTFLFLCFAKSQQLALLEKRFSHVICKKKKKKKKYSGRIAYPSQPRRDCNGDKRLKRGGWRSSTRQASEAENRTDPFFAVTWGIVC